MVVYMARNTVNGKVYIGKSVRGVCHARQRHLQRAKFQWRYGCYSYFYNALRKYGSNSFEWTILYHGFSDEDIQQKEREFIEKLEANNPDVGYNMTPGGDGGAGKTLSKAHREKTSQAFRGHNNPQYGKFGHEHPAFGHRHSTEAKEAIGKSHRGKRLSEEQRAKLSKAKLAAFAPQREARKAAQIAERKYKAEVRENKKALGAFRGENAGASKVCDAARADICVRRSSGESYKSISQDYPLGLTGIRAIVQSWGPLNGYPANKVFAKSNHREVLTPSQRQDLCRRYAAGEKCADLAFLYGVGETTAYETIRTWGPANGFAYAPRKKPKDDTNDC